MQTETKPEPTVRCFEATAGFRTMTRIANVFVRPLLRSSAGKGIHELALLCFEVGAAANATRCRSSTTSWTASR